MIVIVIVMRRILTIIAITVTVAVIVRVAVRGFEVVLARENSKRTVILTENVIQ